MTTSERRLLIRTAAALSAAVELLTKGGKKACASDAMFRQCLTDYRNTVRDVTRYINRPKPTKAKRQPSTPPIAWDEPQAGTR